MSYDEEEVRTGMELLIVPFAGKSHQFPNWNRRVMPSLRDLALAACTQSLHSQCAPVHTSLQLGAFLDEEGALRNEEQIRVILPWPLISIAGDGDHLCIRLCKEPGVTRASMQGQPGITQRPRDAAY